MSRCALAAGVVIAVLAPACSFVGVNVPRSKPAPPELECSYKLPIIDSAFVVGSVAGALAVANTKPGYIDLRSLVIWPLISIAFFDGLSAVYGFVEERRCYREFAED